MQGPYLRKYGVETKINFVLYEVDGVDFRVDAADGGTDCSVMKDEGAEATCTNDFVDEGTGYSLTLTATEMQAARIVVYVIDSATKAWLDESIIIETYGNASAMHAFDLDTATQSVAVTSIGNDVVTAASINTGALTSDAFAADAIVAATLATGALTADAFAADAIVAATLATDSITSDAIAAAAIDNATFAADVGSTAYATNIIALAVQKALVEYKLDHLVHTADADDVANDSIIGKLASTDGDWSNFVDTTDSLQSIRDHIGDGTNLTEAGGDGDHLTAINLPNQTMDITGDITGNLSGSVGSVTAFAADSITAAALNADAVAEIADAIFDEDESGHTTADSFGQYLRQIKFAVINKQEITEADGATVIYEDDDTTAHATVAAAYTTNATTTTRKRLE